MRCVYEIGNIYTTMVIFADRTFKDIGRKYDICRLMWYNWLKIDETN